MAHFAKLDDSNVVLAVYVVSNDDIKNLPFPESEPLGVEFLKVWSNGYEKWKQTSYNSNFRKNYAGIGYTYNEVLDAFIAPQPFPSWSLDESTATWQPPIPMPFDGNIYDWNENSQVWDLSNV